MRVVVVEAPEPIIDTDEVKEHLRVDHDDDDMLIDAYLAAATATLDGPDGTLGRAIGIQVLEARLDAFESATYLRLPCPPLVEVISATWTGSDGLPRSCGPDDFEVVGETIVDDVPPWSGMKVTAPLRVRYRAGYEDVPPPIRVAILMMVSDMYRYRGTAIGTGGALAVSTSAQMLLQPYRVYA